jgi:hypothetical protein
MLKLVKPILYILLLIANSNIIAQSESDKIAYRDVSLSGVNIGSDINCIFKKFGKPDSIIVSFNEMQDSWGKRYVYANSFFDVSNGRITGFKILNSTFLFDFGKIKIADDVKVLIKLFPKSYLNRYLDPRNNEIIKVRIGNSDDYCLFRIHENKIIEISTWQDL